MRGMDINFRLRAAIRKDEEARVFVSYCPALDLFAQGRSLGEAKAALQDTIHLLLSTHYRKKTLNDFLSEHGFIDVGGSGDVGSTVAHDEFIDVPGYQDPFEINIPIHLKAGALEAHVN
jgi:hypothetical protein